MMKRKYLSQWVTSLNLSTPPSTQSSSQFSPTPPGLLGCNHHLFFPQFKSIRKCNHFMTILWNYHFKKSFTINTDKICPNVMLEPILDGVELSSVHRSPRPHQVRTWYLKKQRLPGLVWKELLFQDLKSLQMKCAVFYGGDLFEAGGDIGTPDTCFRPNPFHLFNFPSLTVTIFQP